MKRPNIKPGEIVTFESDAVAGNIPLFMPTPKTPDKKRTVSGWIISGEPALVIAVMEDHIFLLSKQGNGWGWIDDRYIRKFWGKVTYRNAD